ncbi:MAG TPA: hypothetical protein VKP30_13170 [Polyangiaceae bacterium]|nr:hypothetical protein [Polyangiaceae bacterium]
MIQNQQLARLLSGRDEPSVLEKEEHFRQLLQRLPSQSRSAAGSRFARLLVALGGLSLAGAATGAFLLMRGHSSDSQDTFPGAGEFAPRGVAHDQSEAASASVRLACIDAQGKPLSCAIGRTLVFEFDAIPKEYAFFSAFAQTPDGTTLWYYPDAEGQSPALERSNALQNRAIRLEPPHTEGEYRIYSIFSRTPVTRADIRTSLGSALVSNERLLVVMRAITVQGRQ